MPKIVRVLLAVLFFTGSARADGLDTARQELRDSIGDWDVTTEFLNTDGSVDQSVEGSYHFRWVVRDRVAQGSSSIPDLDQRSALLIYLRESTNEIEMASVGDDGKLWVMTGDAGDDSRYSQEYETPDGGRAQLRFTRSAVEPDRFESHMHYSLDGGKSWRPGNHQIFVRVTSSNADATSLPDCDLPVELRRVLREYEVAWAAKDASALAGLFAEDGYVLSPGRPPVHGRSAIEERYRDSGGPLALRAFHYEIDGDLAVVLGGYGRERGQPDEGKFTLTLREIDGRWWILSDMDNSNVRR